MFSPALLTVFRNRKSEICKNQLIGDITAGIIVAIVALPLSVALAIASGVSPEKGLITAIIAGFIISFLGGSRVQIGGPTAAFVVIVYGIVEKYGFAGLTAATVLSGIILVIFGLLRFGSFIKFIPYPIVKGFTLGIAAVLFLTQVKDFLGLGGGAVPSDFIDKIRFYISNIKTINFTALFIGCLTVFIILICPKINKKIPGAFVALITAAVCVWFFKLPVETIGSKFGELSSKIPAPHFVLLDFKTIKELIQPAFTIAVLAAVESLLSAVVADGMTGKKHNSNIELVAQGLANIASALFGGIPATGAIARTATNIKSGGKTPIAGITHAIVLFLIMILFMPLAKLIPMASLAAILIVVAYNMSDYRACISLLKSTKSDTSIMLLTFVLTVVFDLVLAIELGMVIAMFLFIKKMADATRIKDLSDSLLDASEDDNKLLMPDNMAKYKSLSDNVIIYDINGPLFFGAASDFMSIINEVNIKADILILNMKNVPIMDASALNSLMNIRNECRVNHILPLYTGVQEQLMALLEKAGFCSLVGYDKFFKDINDALLVSNDIIELKKTANKKRRVKQSA